MIGDAIRTGVRWFVIGVLVFLVVQHTNTVVSLATSVVGAAKSTAGAIARFADEVGGAASEKPTVKPEHKQ